MFEHAGAANRTKKVTVVESQTKPAGSRGPPARRGRQPRRARMRRRQRAAGCRITRPVRRAQPRQGWHGTRTHSCGRRGIPCGLPVTAMHGENRPSSWAPRRRPRHRRGGEAAARRRTPSGSAGMRSSPTRGRSRSWPTTTSARCATSVPRWGRAALPPGPVLPRAATGRAPRLRVSARARGDSLPHLP
jgi:hypothetical protein